MARWQPNVTSVHVIGSFETSPRKLVVQTKGMGAGDTLKIQGRVNPCPDWIDIGFTNKTSGAFVAGGAGLVATNAIIEADVTGMEVALSYTKATNNGDINFSETPA